MAPRPTKLRPASTIIATPASTVTITISGDRMWGTTWRRRIVDRRSPRLRAASTNVSSRTAKVGSRVMRAKPGAKTIPTAIIEFVSPGPMAATTAMARMIGGKRHERLDEPHDDPVGRAAEVPGEEAGEEPDRHADADGLDGGEQRQPGGVHQPAQHVTAEVVGAEEVAGRTRRQEDGPQVLRVRVVGCEHRARRPPRSR